MTARSRVKKWGLNDALQNLTRKGILRWQRWMHREFRCHVCAGERLSLGTKHTALASNRPPCKSQTHCILSVWLVVWPSWTLVVSDLLGVILVKTSHLLWRWRGKIYCKTLDTLPCSSNSRIPTVIVAANLITANLWLLWLVLSTLGHRGGNSGKTLRKWGELHGYGVPVGIYTGV